MSIASRIADKQARKSLRDLFKVTTVRDGGERLREQLYELKELSEVLKSIKKPTCILFVLKNVLLPNAVKHSDLLGNPTNHYKNTILQVSKSTFSGTGEPSKKQSNFL